MMSPKVFIIVLNWNGYQDTVECVNSLKAITYPNYRKVLVDNGSTDGSEHYYANDFLILPLSRPDIISALPVETISECGMHWTTARIISSY